MAHITHQYVAASVAPTIIPRISPPVSDLVGREQTLCDLQTHIRTGTVVCVITGMGGIGKTELARALAQRLAADYPDGGITVDLRGTSEPPADPGQALANMLRLLTGDEVHPKSTLAERCNLYQGVLANKKVIVHLDDARDAAQVGPLLPPPPSLAIVTSRNSIVVPGMFMITLDSLPMQDAIGLLLGICERIGDKASAIATACGCLPLALRLAGSALAGDLSLSLDRYLRMLTDQDERLGFAQKALQASYDLLEDDIKPFWCQLAVFPADFDAYGAAAIWGFSDRQDTTTEQDADDARDALSALLRVSMIQWDGDQERYALHDLARTYALYLLGRDFPQALMRTYLRHAEHYRDVLYVAESLYLGGPDTAADGLALLDQEWANIQAGQGWAAAQASQYHEALSLTSLYCAKANLLDLRRPPRERIVWLEAALAAAIEMDDLTAQASHLGNLALALADLGTWDLAVDLCQSQLALARELNDRVTEGKALGNLGNFLAQQSKWPEAIAHYEDQYEIASEIGDLGAQVAALGNLGAAYINLLDWVPAIGALNAALSIMPEQVNQRAVGSILGNLGNAYLGICDTEQAITLHQQALEIDRALGDALGEAQDLGNLANAYRQAGQVRQAKECLQQACMLFEKRGSPEAERTRRLLDELDAS